MKSKIQIVNELDDEFIFEDESRGRRHEKMKANRAAIEPQFIYLGRLVNKRHFRAFVWGDQGQKLAKNYDEFEKYVSSGLWFPTKEEFEASKSVVKPKKSEKSTKKLEKTISLHEKIANENEIKVDNEINEISERNVDEEKKDDDDLSSAGVIEYGANR